MPVQHEIRHAGRDQSLVQVVDGVRAGPQPHPSGGEQHAPTMPTRRAAALADNLPNYAGNPPPARRPDETLARTPGTDRLALSRRAPARISRIRGLANIDRRRVM